MRKKESKKVFVKKSKQKRKTPAPLPDQSFEKEEEVEQEIQVEEEEKEPDFEIEVQGLDSSPEQLSIQLTDQEIQVSQAKQEIKIKPDIQEQKKPVPIRVATEATPQVAYPPPEDIYIPQRSTVRQDYTNFGLNMVFKKAHEFSEDRDQAGGDLNPNQSTSSMPWGVGGCPTAKQIDLIKYVKDNLKQIVFCRYGLDYLRTFRDGEGDIAMGSFKINLDYLICQKQRHLELDDNNGLIGMSFLKQKGQLQQQKGENNNAANMIIPYYKRLQDYESTSLQFDSVFESGNLALAIQVSETEYNCVLQNDINTNGHTQWYYFKVKSDFQKKTSVKINLVNLYKSKSLYQYGLKVLVLDCSNKDENAEAPKWVRCGRDITYQQNNFTNQQCPNGLFSLSFTYDFDEGPQEMYFAHSMPFTYTMLSKWLTKNATKEKAKRQILCHSLAGNRIEYLYITSRKKETDTKQEFQSAQKEQEPKSPFKRQRSIGKKEKKKVQEQLSNKPLEKQVIVITSRVHPGETNASWMVQGLMDTLLNPKEDEEELVNNLKDHFEFYIVPMLNVDGVINGNYRCSLAACDLNRKYSKPSRVLHPPVYHMKKLCQQLVDTEKKQFFLYLDLHGHSAKKNIFNYGNTNFGLPFKQGKVNHTPSTFPLVLSKQKGFDYFSYQDCTFSMPASKASTARISIFQKLRIPFVFTLEASFAGASKGALAGKHFSQGDLENVGKYVLQAIWDVKKLELNKSALKMLQEEAQSNMKVADLGADDSGDASSDDDAQIPTAPNKSGKNSQKFLEDGTSVPAEGTNSITPGHSPKKQTESGRASPIAFGTKSPQPTTPRDQEPQISPKKKIITLRQMMEKKEKDGTLSGGQSRQYGRISGTAESQPQTSSKKYKNQPEFIQHPHFQVQEPQRHNQFKLIPEPQKELARTDEKDKRNRNSIIHGLPHPSDSGYVHGMHEIKSQGMRSMGNNFIQMFGPNPADMDTSMSSNVNLNMNKINPHNSFQAKPSYTNSQYSYNEEQSNAGTGYIETSQRHQEQRQQELYEQFNNEIEQTFNQQQAALDEIFKQATKNFIKNERRSQIDQTKETMAQFQLDPNEVASRGQRMQSFAAQNKRNSYFNFKDQGDGSPQKNQQIETLMQLQRLHQMQKLNQVAQMQFFKQQAELLLSQNLSQQKQLELFYNYQEQIQMQFLQNQQYQIMLSNTIYKDYKKRQQPMGAPMPQEFGSPSRGVPKSNYLTPTSNSQFGHLSSNASQMSSRNNDPGFRTSAAFNKISQEKYPNQKELFGKILRQKKANVLKSSGGGSVSTSQTNLRSGENNAILRADQIQSLRVDQNSLHSPSKKMKGQQLEEQFVQDFTNQSMITGQAIQNFETDADDQQQMQIPQNHHSPNVMPMQSQTAQQFWHSVTNSKNQGEPQHRRKPSDFENLMNVISTSSKELQPPIHRDEMKKNVVRIRKDQINFQKKAQVIQPGLGTTNYQGYSTVQKKIPPTQKKQFIVNGVNINDNDYLIEQQDIFSPQSRFFSQRDTRFNNKQRFKIENMIDHPAQMQHTQQNYFPPANVTRGSGHDTNFKRREKYEEKKSHHSSHSPQKPQSSQAMLRTVKPQLTLSEVQSNSRRPDNQDGSPTKIKNAFM